MNTVVIPDELIVYSMYRCVPVLSVLLFLCEDYELFMESWSCLCGVALFPRLSRLLGGSLVIGSPSGTVRPPLAYG